ncbi:hypothetical protein Tco_1447098 [Tanacetum coccineum]
MTLILLLSSTWMALKEIHVTWAHLEKKLHGDGIVGIKRCRRDVSSDGVRNFATVSGRGQLKEDLESSTWRRRQDF